MDRRDFVLGLVNGLGLAGATTGSATANSAVPHVTLDDSYLVRGLTGMAQAKGWFDAHWGAAVIAGYFLCQENQLDPTTVAEIKSQLDLAINARAEQFAPFRQQTADIALIERIPQALEPAIEGGLREHGHAVIFAALSMKALHAAPEIAQPALVEALCGLSKEIARRPAERPARGSDTSYTDTGQMIQALFDNLARFKPLLGHPSIRRPNFTHMTTHTEALLCLHEMGYEELAHRGFLGHRAHVAAPLPTESVTLPTKRVESGLESIMSNDYWQDPVNRQRWNKRWDGSTNPNGHWIASGHLFKVLYSFHRLIRHVRDQQLVQNCSQILLERYFNPEIQGG